MPTHCFTPVLGKRIRVTRLDACGRPPAAATADSFVATDGFISLTLSSEVEDGTEIITRKADGSLCVNEKSSDSFKHFTLEIEFCGVNPDLLSLVSNAIPYADYSGDKAGFTVADGELNKKFALELWTGLSGQGCSTAAGATEASGYLLLPYLNAGVLGDITVDGENAVTFSLTGSFTRSGNAWGKGPYNVVLDGGVAKALPTALAANDHLLIIDTNVAPPPSACSLQPMPAAPVVLTVPLTGVGAASGNVYAFIPANGTLPADLATLKADGVVGDSGSAKPSNSPWTTGKYILLGDGSKAHWTGTAWAAGAA